MRKVVEFLKEVKAEFKNITWPKKDALIELTIVVISISIFVSLILGGFDYLFTQGFSILGNLKNPIQLNSSTDGQTIDILPPEASATAITAAPATSTPVKK